MDAWEKRHALAQRHVDTGRRAKCDLKAPSGVESLLRIACAEHQSKPGRPAKVELVKSRDPARRTERIETSLSRARMPESTISCAKPSR